MRKSAGGIVGVLLMVFGGRFAAAADVQVSQPPDNASPIQDNDTSQAETSHAAFGSTAVATFNDSSQFASLGFGLTTFQRYSYSTNGGTSWTDGGLLPAPSGQQILGDPAIVVDAAGVFYIASLVGPAGALAPSGVAVYRSTSTSPTVTFGAGVVVNGPLGTGDDKESMAIDVSGGTYNGRVYLAWSEFPSPFSPAAALVVARSTGVSPLTFTPATTLVPSSLVMNHGTTLAVGPGGEVYLGWAAFTTTGGQITGGSIQLLKSTDGGVNWVNPDPADPAANKTVATLATTPNTLSTGGVTIRTRDFPYVAVDSTPTGSWTRGNVYIVYQAKTDPSSTDNSDVFFASSFDGGAHWTTPRTINTGPSAVLGGDTTTNDNWQPSISVSPTTGQITITFYDRRDDPANKLIRVYKAVSTDAGNTWFNQPLSTTSFTPDTGYDSILAPTYMGDYNSARPAGNKTMATWGDLRNTCSPPGGATSPCSPAGRSDMDVWGTGDALLNGPDLAITPWGYVSGNGPTWQTPDIFVVDGMGNVVNAAKGIINHLRARIRNVGQGASSGATVTFKFAPWFTGITDAALKTIGTVSQDLTPGATAVVPIDWDLTNTADTNGGLWPAPVSAFTHFCVKVTITLASDVNLANNSAQNNFVDVADGFTPFGFRAFMVGNPFERPVEAVLRLTIPKGYRASVDGVPGFDKSFRLQKGEIKLARVSFQAPPRREPPPRTDQVAHIDMQIGKRLIGGLSVRLAQANRRQPETRAYGVSVEKAVAAIVALLHERREPVALADAKRGMVNSGQVKLSTAALRRLVDPKALKNPGKATGRYNLSFHVAPVETTDSRKGGVVVALSSIIIIDTNAYVLTGGVGVPSNGTLEKEIFAGLSRLIGP